MRAKHEKTFTNFTALIASLPLLLLSTNATACVGNIVENDFTFFNNGYSYLAVLVMVPVCFIFVLSILVLVNRRAAIVGFLATFAIILATLGWETEIIATYIIMIPVIIVGARLCRAIEKRFQRPENDVQGIKITGRLQVIVAVISILESALLLLLLLIIGKM